MKELFAAGLLMLCVKFTFALSIGRDNFLTYGPGAAEEAMGDATVAISAGPESLYYNSAALGAGPSALSGEWLNLGPGLSYSWLGASANLGFAGLGLGLINLDLGDITARSSISDSGTSASSYQRAYLVGSAREVLPGFRAGSTVGLLDYNLAGFSSRSFFSDLGFSYKAFDGLNLGLAVKNAYFSGLKFGGETERYPREFRLGGAWSDHGFILAGQADKVSDGSAPTFGLGASYSLFKILTFRAGFHGYPRFGLGFRTYGGRFLVDLSYQARAIVASERVTLSYFFKTVPEDSGPKDPYVELEERAASLADFYREESRRLLEARSMGAAEALKKLLALEPWNSDAAQALSAETGSKFQAVGKPWRLPWLKRRNRAYLRFAVAYGDDKVGEACSTGAEFRRRWPEDGRGALVGWLTDKNGCAKAGPEENK